MSYREIDQLIQIREPLDKINCPEHSILLFTTFEEGVVDAEDTEFPDYDLVEIGFRGIG